MRRQAARRGARAAIAPILAFAGSQLVRAALPRRRGVGRDGAGPPACGTARRGRCAFRPVPAEQGPLGLRRGLHGDVRGRADGDTERHIKLVRVAGAPAASPASLIAAQSRPRRGRAPHDLRRAGSDRHGHRPAAGRGGLRRASSAAVSWRWRSARIRMPSPSIDSRGFSRPARCRRARSPGGACRSSYAARSMSAACRGAGEEAP